MKPVAILAMLLLTLPVYAVSPPLPSSGPSCGDLISGNVVLTADIGPCPALPFGDHPAAGGLEINASNTVLDCVGHIIVSDGTINSMNAGILVQADNVTVKNCVVRGFQFGIAFLHSANSSVVGNDASFNQEVGIEFDYSSNIFVSGNFVNGSVNGIYLWDSGSNTLVNNTVTRNVFGFTLVGTQTSNNTMKLNSATNSSAVGFYLAPGDPHERLTKNTVSYSGIGYQFCHNSVSKFAHNHGHHNGRKVLALGRKAGC
jgi:parallel beta-helix repeat protein